MGPNLDDNIFPAIAKPIALNSQAAAVGIRGTAGVVGIPGTEGILDRVRRSVGVTSRVRAVWVCAGMRRRLIAEGTPLGTEWIGRGIRIERILAQLAEIFRVGGERQNNRRKTTTWRASDKRNDQWTQPTPRMEISASRAQMVPENVFLVPSELSSCKVHGQAMPPQDLPEQLSGTPRWFSLCHRTTSTEQFACCTTRVGTLPRRNRFSTSMVG